MGRLAIRRVVYSGDKYSFESPYLNDGIVIMEGVNGHGKSTFMNLIYYGLGGRVQAFNKNDDNDSKKHNEIFYDTNNYVELLIEIDDEKWRITAFRKFSQWFPPHFPDALLPDGTARLQN